MNAPSLPVIRDDDSDDVRWALETAGAIWGRGDFREALSWVRRAAEAAAEAGADQRALQLAKSAAELRATLELPRTAPPPAPKRGQPPVAQPVKKATERVRHHAVRVAVSLSMEEMGALLAKPMKPGEELPPGSHEALLVAIDSDADLFVFKG